MPHQMCMCQFPSSPDRNYNNLATCFAWRAVSLLFVIMSSSAVPFSSALAKKSKVFNNLMAHINCCGQMTMAQWEEVFGEVTEQNPWGDRFWNGFQHLMTSQYRPQMRKHRHLGNLAPSLAYFELPCKFAKASARQVKGECNPGSSQQYPAWVWYECKPPGCAWVVCINICIWNSSPWFVDGSWISPVVTHSSPDYATFSTVVIEEIDDSEEEVEV
jgi:hypothetical protein